MTTDTHYMVEHHVLIHDSGVAVEHRVNVTANKNSLMGGLTCTV